MRKIRIEIKLKKIKGIWNEFSKPVNYLGDELSEIYFNSYSRVSFSFKYFAFILNFKVSPPFIY